LITLKKKGRKTVVSDKTNTYRMVKSTFSPMFMSTPPWMNIWSMCKQYVQHREVSDHCALVVKSMEKDCGPKPF